MYDVTVRVYITQIVFCNHLVVANMGGGQYCNLGATVIGLLKFGLLLYANEILRHIFQILKNTTGH